MMIVPTTAIAPTASGSRIATCWARGAMTGIHSAVVVVMTRVAPGALLSSRLVSVEGVASIIRERQQLGKECGILHRGRRLREQGIELVELHVWIIVGRQAGGTLD